MLLSQLEYFRVVARHEHISHAAEELCIAQPALSATISKMEKELGVPLFNRTGRNIELNDAGRRLLTHADYIFGQISAMDQALAKTQELLENEITISVSNSMFLGGWLHNFVLENPKIRLRQRMLSEAQMVEALMNETIDVAIGEFDSDIPGIVRKVIVEDEYVFSVAKSHPLAQKESVVFEDIRNENVISLPSNTIYKIADKVFALKECKPNIVFEGNHRMMSKLEMENKGIVFSTKQMIYTMYQAEKLKELAFVEKPVVIYSISDLDCRCKFCLCWKKGRELPAMAHKFIDAMEQSYPRYYDDESYKLEYKQFLSPGGEHE